jgi:hypothetical protein
MGIAIKIFVIYIAIFIVIFWWDHKRGKETNRKLVRYFIPLAGLVALFMLTVVKIFIIYKIIILVVLTIAGGLIYWHFRDK